MWNDDDRLVWNCHGCQLSQSSRHSKFGVLWPLPSQIGPGMIPLRISKRDCQSVMGLMRFGSQWINFRWCNTVFPAVQRLTHLGQPSCSQKRWYILMDSRWPLFRIEGSSLRWSFGARYVVFLGLIIGSQQHPTPEQMVRRNGWMQHWNNTWRCLSIISGAIWWNGYGMLSSLQIMWHWTEWSAHPSSLCNQETRGWHFQVNQQSNKITPVWMRIRFRQLCTRFMNTAE